MVKLYGIYKTTSDLDGLPDDAGVFCDSCAAVTSGRRLVEINSVDDVCACCGAD